MKMIDGDLYSAETGLAVCIAKKALGNKGNFNDEFKKWIHYEKFEASHTIIPELAKAEDIAANIWSKFKDFYNAEKNKEEKTND